MTYVLILASINIVYHHQCVPNHVKHLSCNVLRNYFRNTLLLIRVRCEEQNKFVFLNFSEYWNRILLVKRKIFLISTGLTKHRKFIVTRTATGFKPLQLNCWQINQLTLKCQIDFYTKLTKKV